MLVMVMVALSMFMMVLLSVLMMMLPVFMLVFFMLVIVIITVIVMAVLRVAVICMAVVIRIAFYASYPAGSGFGASEIKLGCVQKFSDLDISIVAVDYLGLRL